VPYRNPWPQVNVDMEPPVAPYFDLFNVHSAVKTSAVYYREVETNPGFGTCREDIDFLTAQIKAFEVGARGNAWQPAVRGSLLEMLGSQQCLAACQQCSQQCLAAGCTCRARGGAADPCSLSLSRAADAALSPSLALCHCRRALVPTTHSQLARSLTDGMPPALVLCCAAPPWCSATVGASCGDDDRGPAAAAHPRGSALRQRYGRWGHGGGWG
jgi:hypothetical protein